MYIKIIYKPLSILVEVFKISYQIKRIITVMHCGQRNYNSFKNYYYMSCGAVEACLLFSREQLAQTTRKVSYFDWKILITYIDVNLDKFKDKCR